MSAKKLATHAFSFNPRDNGDEQLILTTEYFDNDDGGVFTNQELSLQSCCNSASFELVGAQITPQNLRKLADELEQQNNKLKQEIKEKANDRQYLNCSTSYSRILNTQG